MMVWIKVKSEEERRGGKGRLRRRGEEGEWDE
jgi:hypothetical protein